MNKLKSKMTRTAVALSRVQGLITIGCLIILAACQEFSAAKNDETTNSRSDSSAIALHNLKLMTLEGQPIPADSLVGKVAFVNYWATWCKPCIEEMPSIEQAQKNFDSRDVQFLFATNESKMEVESFRGTRFPDLRFVNVMNYGDQDIVALPTTHIYDRNGKLKFSKSGFRNWNDSSHLSLIKQIIDTP